jgi:hypothetical protein
VEKEHVRAVKSYEKAVRDREKVIQARAKLEQKKERRAQTDTQKAAKAAEKAKKKAELQARNQASQAPQAELTQSQKEHLRLEEEKRRMEAEGRRMRGEPSPENRKEEEDDENWQLQPSTRSTDPAPTPPLQHLSSPARTPPLQSPSSLSPSPSRSSEAKPSKPLKDRKFCTLPPKDSAGQRDPLWVRVFMENVDEVGAHCGLFFVDERYERLVGEVADRLEMWVREAADGRVSRAVSVD